MPPVEHVLSEGVSNLLSKLAVHVGKPLVMFFDEVDCLSEGTLVSFLRQLRQGRISCVEPNSFPSSVALIGMRDIRDYKAKIRPAAETLGSASPFNVITEAMTLRSFTEPELRALYRQHTDETGQDFEEKSHEKAYDQVCGYMDRLGVGEGWLVVFDPDLSKPWDGKIFAEDVPWHGKTIHLIGC